MSTDVKAVDSEVWSLSEAAERLTQLEAEWAACSDHFLKGACILAEISTNRLYLAKNGGEYTNFADYCKAELGISKRKAYYLIEAAREFGEKAQSKLCTTVHTPEEEEDDGDDHYVPETAGEARKAIEDKKASARLKEPKPAPPPITDVLGREVPNKSLAKVFTDGIQEFNTLEALLDQSGRSLVALAETRHGHRIFLQTVQGDLKKIKTAVLHAKPFAICPYCKGEGTPGCKGCLSFGWANRSTYDAAPAKDKK